MTAHFRNVDVDPASDPDTWPFEAVLSAIERGALSDWRRLTASVRRDPWGPCARAIDQIVSWREHDSLDSLFDGVLNQLRAVADREDAQGR